MMSQGDNDSFYTLQAFQSDELQHCLDALETLRQQDYLHFVPVVFLLNCLKATTSEREQADILKLIGSLEEPLEEAALTTLLDHLEAFPPALQREVVNALTVDHAEDVLERLFCLIEDFKEESNEESAKWEDFLPAEVLFALLAHSDTEVCAGALDVLSQLPHQLIPLDIVLPYCLHEDGTVREVALKTLVAAEQRVPPEPILAALRDPETTVRAVASHACISLVNWFGEQIPLEPLVQALNDSSSPVREDLLDALGKAPKRAPIEPVAAALTDSTFYVRCAAVETLGLLGQRVPPAIKPIIQIISESDPDPRVRTRAAATLLKLA